MNDFKIGDNVVHQFPVSATAFYGRMGTVIDINDAKFTVQFSKTEKHIFTRNGIVSFRLATENDLSIANFVNWFKDYEHSDDLRIYLEWLREAGSEGVSNDCSCPKNEMFNKTCSCKTLVKINHRFSTFKDVLQQKCGYKLEDIKQNNYKHKTVLLYEPEGFKEKI